MVMNKRGQVYILAAVLLSIAIFGVMKVSNRLEPPAESRDFDFFVENFLGERSNVVNFGYLKGEDVGKYLTEDANSLVKVFTEFNPGVEIVLVSCKGGSCEVDNFLEENVVIDAPALSCSRNRGPNGCIIEGRLERGSGHGELGLSLGGREEEGDDESRADFSYDPRVNLADINPNVGRGTINGDFNLRVGGNSYNFDVSNVEKYESIIFKDVDDNYVRVVRV